MRQAAERAMESKVIRSEQHSDYFIQSQAAAARRRRPACRWQPTHRDYMQAMLQLQSPAAARGRWRARSASRPAPTPRRAPAALRPRPRPRFRPAGPRPYSKHSRNHVWSIRCACLENPGSGGPLAARDLPPHLRKSCQPSWRQISDLETCTAIHRTANQSFTWRKLQT